MNCQKVHKNLIFYFEDGLSVQLRNEIEIHLTECSGCAEYANFLKYEVQDIDYLKSIVASPYLYTRIQGKLESKTIVSKLKWLQPAIITMVIVVSLISGIGLTNTFWNKYQNSNTNTNSNSSNYTAYSTESVEYTLLQSQN
jgi:hypothetical protein